MAKKVSVLALSILFINSQFQWSDASILDYFWPSRNAFEVDSSRTSLPLVPFETIERDESFLAESAKLLGNKQPSKLDLCQQRVILLLKDSCKSLSDEQIGKLAVYLLNCQHQAEGRKVVECSETTSLKDCVGQMGPEMVESYQLFVHRAKAVCMAIRQEQFRGLTEIAVNKLIQTTLNNIERAEALKIVQDQIHGKTLELMAILAENNQKIVQQQHELASKIEAQLIGSQANVHSIERGRDLVKQMRSSLSTHLTSVKDRIEQMLLSFDRQHVMAQNGYQKVLENLKNLDNTAVEIHDRLEEANRETLEQNQKAQKMLKATVADLANVNKIASQVSKTADNIRSEVMQILEWLSFHLGGKDNMLQNLSLIAIHIVYLLIGMLCLSFVNADISSRILLLCTLAVHYLIVIWGVITFELIQFTEVIFAVLIANWIIKLSKRYDIKKYVMGLTDMDLRDAGTSERTHFKGDNNNNVLLDNTNAIGNGSVYTSERRTSFSPHSRTETNHLGFGLSNPMNMRREHEFSRESTQSEGNQNGGSRASTDRTYESRLNSRRSPSNLNNLNSDAPVTCAAITLRGTRCRRKPSSFCTRGMCLHHHGSSAEILNGN